MKDSRNQGIKESRNQESRNQGIKESGIKDAISREEGIKVYRPQHHRLTRMSKIDEEGEEGEDEEGEEEEGDDGEGW